MDLKILIREVGAEMLNMFEDVWARKNAFFALFFVFFCLSYGVMVAIDFVPEEPKAKPAAPVVVETTKAVEATTTAPKVAEVKKIAQYPIRILIEKIGTDVAVLNPSDSSVKVMDTALLKGAVRHPGSADFSETGTMFLFGHSSYLPKVFNKNYQAFNGIQNLVTGDVIRVNSDDMAYEYHVTKVYKAEASQASITLSHEKNGLVLVTCNSFGSKDDRYVVEADFAGKNTL